jgi:Sensors of blue-light using FAD
MLVRCLYASRASEGTDARVLDEILRQSRENNTRSGITGLLILANGIFVQVIEGGRGEVSNLLARIMRDSRNRQVEVLAFEEITERSFGSWTMGQVSMASVNAALVLKYSERPDLDPFSMTASATMSFLQELAGSGAIAQRCG